MRRMIITSLLLLPVVAHAQASTSTETPTSSSEVMHAELIQPAVPAKLAMKAASPAVSVATLGTANHALIREFVSTKMMGNFASQATMRDGGTLEYVLMSDAPMEASAPKVIRTVEMGLSTQDLVDQPAVSNVVLQANVDESGVPRNVSVTQSAGSVIDRKAVEAVSQYRFKPATLGNRPTWATVSIAIKIQKP